MEIENKMIKPKTFFNFLENYSINELELEKLLKDNRLTLLEKKILKGWISLRKCKFEELISELEPMTASPDPIIEAQKTLLLGIAYINKSESQKALVHLHNSLDLHKPFALHRQDFIILTNLFYAYLNLKNKKGMKEIVTLLKEKNYTSESEKLVINRIEFKYLAYCGNYQDAEEILEEIEKSKQLVGNQLIYHLISKFDFFIKIDNFKGCLQILEKIKKAKDYHIGANYKFMNQLLQHFTNDKTLYIYEKDFTGHPLLWNQIAVIKYLEEKNLEMAKRHWNYLQAISKDTYQADFHYDGDKCLFSICLNKNLKNQKKSEFKLHFLESTPKEERLLIILKMQPSITKEDLYFELWGEYAPDKGAFNKLERIISTIRKEHKLTIKFKKGTYSLDKKAA